MDLDIFDRFFPSLKPRALIDERKLDMNRSDKNIDIYVIPMHRRNVWTNEWMQDPRNNLLHIGPYDPGAKNRRGWGSVTRKRGLTLYYSYKRPGYLAKEFSDRRHSCLCCKAMDHEVLEFPRMIAKVERMNME